MRVTEIGPIALTRHPEYSVDGTTVPACLTCNVTISVETEFNFPDERFELRIPTRISPDAAEPIADAEARALRQLARDLRSIAAAIEAQHPA